MAAWVKEHPRRRGAQLVFVIAIVLYTVSGPFSGVNRATIDTNASALTSQRIVTHGDVDGTAFRDASRWFVASGDRFVSNRPPGMALFALPFYVLVSPVLSDVEPEPGPSLAAASFITAAAMAVLYMALREVTTPQIALLTAITYAVATPTWGFSGLAIWPHGPGQLLLASLMYILLTDRMAWLLAPIGALAILTRPLVAIPLIVVGFWLIARRRWSQALPLAMGGLLGVALFLGWNAWVFDDTGALGPYGGQFIDKAANLTLGVYALRLGGTFLDPKHGILFVTPVIVIACVTALRRVRSIRPELLLFSTAGLAYILVHIAFNRFNPGLLLNYRYPIEAITLAAPLGAVGVAITAKSRRNAAIVVGAVIFGGLFQTLDVFGVSDLWYFVNYPAWLPWSANP